MLFVITAVSAIVPSLLLIWYFWARDVQREPGKVLWATFGLGVLSVVPVLAVELPLSWLIKKTGDPYVQGTLQAFFGAAAPEEAFKLLVLLLYCDRLPDFDEPMDGIVYGAVASLGFATLENVLYVGSGGLSIAVLRAATAVPGHAFWGATLGYYVGQAKFFPANRRRLILSGYLLAFAMHGVYDAPLLTLGALNKLGVPAGGASVMVAATLASFVLSWAFVGRQVRRLRADQLHVAAVRALQAGMEPPAGVLTAAPPTAGARLAGALLIAAGALLASLGVLVTAALGLAMLAPSEHAADRSAVIVGGLLLGPVPFGAGLALFASGLRRRRVQAPLSPWVSRSPH